MMARRFWTFRWAAAGVLAAVAAGAGLVRADPPAGGKEITDEQVVASMRKGIDFLLRTKQADFWEEVTWRNSHKGGETSLVLYALLHAGDSLQDDPEYHAKLHWRGQELSPAIEWISTIKPQSTYAAGMEASALALIPKRPDEKPGEGPRPALEACKAFLIRAMGRDGGYTYYFGNGPDDYKSFGEMWDAYYTALTSGNAAQATAMKGSINSYLGDVLSGHFGNAQWEIQTLATELQARRKAAKNPADAARYAGALAELEKYSHNLPKTFHPEADVAGAKKRYEDLLAAQKSGATQIPNPSNPALMIPLKKEELPELLDAAKKRLEICTAEAKLHFVPLGDLSNGQNGTLGAWALMDYGIELPVAYWTVTDRFWRLMQNEDGGWPYYGASERNAGTRPTTDTMTVAGIASLFVCQEFTDTELRLVPKPDKNIDAGLAWLTKNYKPALASGYYMYGVERVGLSSGLKFFGTTDWYKAGAANVIKRQLADGSWGGDNSASVDTAYCLLFLARGRNPVVFNKLQYNGPWNARPRDSAYVTRWMSKRFEKPINWQVVNLQVSPEEWMDAPILLITGSVNPKFSQEELAKLRTYIHAGGMIFSTADGGTPAFTAAMKKYAGDLVDNKYEMRQLPKEHQLFSKELGVELPNPPGLLGMSNGVREIWIHSPEDVGADWQTRKFTSKNFELGAALYNYASGKGSLRSKLQPLAVSAGSEAAVRTIEVARVDYPGNSDPEPGAWPRMAKLARAGFKTEVKLSVVKFGELDAKKTPLAHLTGTTRVTFTEEDAKGLKNYLDGGGLLLIDAAGGNAEFAASCQELIKKVYPGAVLEPVPQDHPIITGSMADGGKIGEVDFRRFGNARLNRRVMAPALEAVTVDGRMRIVFSAWDICSGFLGTNTWGILGYAPATAETLGRNILLYSVSQGALPADKVKAPK